MASADQEMACRLAEVPLPVAITPWTVSSEFLDDDILEKLSTVYGIGPINQHAVDSDHITDRIAGREDEDSDDYGAEASSWAATRALTRQQRRQCMACQETFIFYELARAPCGHEYCRTCLRGLFQASLTNEFLFPPRCCRQPITCGAGVRMFLTAAIVQLYESKKVEVETPDRTYCSEPFCSSFIPMDNVNEGEANCLACGIVTCTVCKMGGHWGDCPEDTGLQQVLVAADENGWQRCYKCRRVVELELGCHHITCLCRAEFCYLCGEVWKTCQCQQWNEDRLLVRAHQVVARQPAAPVPQQSARLATVVQNLRDRHNCDHEHWRFAGGRHRCEECQDELPAYIFECLQCHMQACNRCRRNRL